MSTTIQENKLRLEVVLVEVVKRSLRLHDHLCGRSAGRATEEITHLDKLEVWLIGDPQKKEPKLYETLDELDVVLDGTTKEKIINKRAGT